MKDICKLVLRDLPLALRRYRVMYVALTLFLSWLTLDVWEFIKSNSDNLQDMQVLISVVFSALIAGLFGVVAKSQDNIVLDEDRQ